MKRVWMALTLVLTLGCLGTSAPAFAQTPVAAHGVLTVFGDGLTQGWENYSWGSSVGLDATPPGDTVAHAVGFEVTAPYGALHLHTSSGVDTSPYAALQFSIEATAPNQIYTVVLYDEKSQQIGRPVPLARYGVNPVAFAWTRYTIPLDQDGLMATKRRIDGIVLQSDSGDPEPIIYVAAVQFVDKATAAAELRAHPVNPAAASVSADTRWSWFLPAVTAVIVGLTALLGLYIIRRETPSSGLMYRQP
ncbi:MAG: hypothetical protein ACYDCQ_13700 [Dehalococcoidia bacterium]